MRLLFLVLVVLVLSIGGCYQAGKRDIEFLKQEVPQFLRLHGFKVLGYQGYRHRPLSGGTVWYTLEKGNITYQASVMEWRKELHLYNLEAIDAIKPNN